MMDVAVTDEPGGPLATAEAAKSIKAIDKTTVHRICSGQVVLTLATAVKELVENSIDAGATSVEVRLRDHGISLLEVCDNGRGVEEHDFEGLTLKHHTSKIQDFGDLVGVKTFGFRGEALSSLCALSNLTIISRHTSQAVGTKLNYDHNGKLSSKTPTSRQVGTTVSLQNLFSTLPVRHKEFHRNIKKEFNKMVQVLYSYCLISTGVRIICTNQTEKGKKTIVVSTDGHNTVKENVSSVFGAKQVSSLIEFKQETASTDVLTEYGMPTLNISQDNTLFTIEGYISSCAHGQGRSTTDRQFYFINSRPCDPAKVIKVVNEVYHQYNRHQSPFVVLNIRLKEEDVDINVTPDKRQILVNNEKIMLATIKTSMMKLYENIPSTYVQNTSFNSSLNRSFDSSPGSRSPSVVSPNVNSSNGRVSALTMKFGRKLGGSPGTESPGTSSFFSSPLSAGLKRSFSHNSDSTSPSGNKQPKLESFFRSKSNPLESCNDSRDLSDSTPPSSSEGSQMCLNSYSLLDEETTERYESSLEPIMEGIEEIKEDIIDNSVLPSKDGESLLGCSQESGTRSADSGKESNGDMISVSEENTTPPIGSLKHEGEILAASCDAVEGSNAYSNGVNVSTENMDDDGNSHVSDQQDDMKSVLSEFSCSSSSGGDAKRSNTAEKSGSPNLKDNVKSVLSKFSHPAVASSPSCKKAHNATNQFLSNLMARKTDKGKTVKKDSSTIDDLDDEISILHADRTDAMSNNNDFENTNESASSSSVDNSKKKIMMCEEYNPDDFLTNRKSKRVAFSLEEMKRKLMASAERKENLGVTRKFHAKIAPTDNQSAEDELRKEISKDMFAKMEILGQFNLGFIIVRLGSDLFIIDQHATDEKFNFETLQQTCVLQNQRLIIPQLLELTAVNESILLDNIEIFKKNGFEFKVDDEKTAGRRVSLVSMPFSRGWEFGRDDIEELIFMLSDAPGVMCRPSRVRAMFASRACRKSIMIGTALTSAQMQKLVSHMGEIEQPWNCPHGRPTMRHLINLDMISSSQTD